MYLLPKRTNQTFLQEVQLEQVFFFFTFGPREEQVICGVYAKNRFRVTFGYVDALNFGATAVFWSCYRIDDTSAVHRTYVAICYF